MISNNLKNDPLKLQCNPCLGLIVISNPVASQENEFNSSDGAVQIDPASVQPEIQSDAKTKSIVGGIQ